MGIVAFPIQCRLLLSIPIFKKIIKKKFKNIIKTFYKSFSKLFKNIFEIFYKFFKKLFKIGQKNIL